jgi:hypothetical protein
MPNGENDPCCDQEARPSGHDLLSAAEPRIQNECCEAEALIDSSKMKNISIHALDFGYNVKIGCQNFAVETPEKLIKNLEAYLNDPQGTERKWLRNKELL